MSQALDVLGGLSAELFLKEYWQKKPLLVRNAMPELTTLLEPSDIKELALEEHVSARLILQKGKTHDQWQTKNAPLNAKDFKKLPQYWTLLVQAVDQHSLELAQMWEKLSFIPQWRRDDIMVSYAPQGGSVGKHFDFYDVFLVQGYGERRWQLGQMCDAQSALVPNQPLKLLQDMHVEFDEVLHPGDLLYVPPGLSHYGVAENDCLTYSFGFRMPNVASMLDRVSDQFADTDHFKTPVVDIARKNPSAMGEISTDEIEHLKHALMHSLSHSDCFNDALMQLMSEPKYPDNIPDADPLALDELFEIAEDGYQIQLDPASRLLYRQIANQIEFWGNGEKITVANDKARELKSLADGQTLDLNQEILSSAGIEYVLDLINNAVIMLIPPQDDEDLL
ncbi:cupin domain-containing protein [Acinetobacter sp. B5B]|uniref:ribosomal protein uL16 3-hydroxylase n=1 Tax=Acinetobacter baretiae TaxID=2605383 RepID=UPI0018C3289B|nr:cupin domain-containing protein [Acinetobacter baretiae]MBF7682368.1 cupin domain-containing protein [Acinetobacter baretiae]MBF7685860.1 cupin domain-containing protein [Acinetobacter baretiae]